MHRAQQAVLWAAAVFAAALTTAAVASPCGAHESAAPAVGHLLDTPAEPPEPPRPRSLDPATDDGTTSSSDGTIDPTPADPSSTQDDPSSGSDPTTGSDDSSVPPAADPSDQPPTGSDDPPGDDSPGDDPPGTDSGSNSGGSDDGSSPDEDQPDSPSQQPSPSGSVSIRQDRRSEPPTADERSAATPRKTAQAPVASPINGPRQPPQDGSYPHLNAAAAVPPAPAQSPAASPWHLLSLANVGTQIFLAGLVGLVISLSGLITIAVRRRRW